MIKKLLLIFMLPLVLTFSFSGCTNKNQEIEKKCNEIVFSIVNSAYDNYGDYSKLSDEYKKSISAEYFEMMNYRTDDNSDYGKLDKDYYELNEVSYPIAVIKDDVVVVSYNYTYECRLSTDNELLMGSDKIPVEVKMKKIDDEYVVVDYYEEP